MNSSITSKLESGKSGPLENESLFQCDFCSKKFESYGIYLVHVLCHKDVCTPKCEACAKLFLNYELYNQHRALVHNSWTETLENSISSKVTADVLISESKTAEGSHKEISTKQKGNLLRQISSV